jgi:hypothetical protein
LETTAYLEESSMSPINPLRRWAADSHARSRRNALMANTALTKRRLEREDVESYLQGLEASRHGELPVPEPRRPR